MAVAFGSSASNSKTYSGADSLAVTAPTGIEVGDFLVAVIGDNGDTNEWGFESGWTNLGFGLSGGTTEFNAWWKIADTDDANAANFTFSVANGTGAVGAWVMRITGTNGFAGSGNISATADDNTSGATNHTFTPGITALSADALWIIGSVAWGDSVVTQSGYAITNDDPTWTEREDFGSDAGSAAVSLAVATANATAQTGSGDYSLTLSASKEATGFLISVEESTNAQVTLDSIALTATPQDPSLSGGAKTTLDQIALTATPQDPTVASASPKWANTGKSDTNPTITNTPKS